jgi:hypothetical protein
VRTRTHVINRKRLLPSQAINDPMKDSVALTCGFDDFVAVAAAAAAAAMGPIDWRAISSLYRALANFS